MIVSAVITINKKTNNFVAKLFLPLVSKRKLAKILLHALIG